MALSAGVTKGLNNRKEALAKEAAKLRALQHLDGSEAAALADAAIVAADRALAEEITTEDAREASRAYAAYLEAHQNIRNAAGIF